MEDRLQLYQRLKGWIGTMLNVWKKFVHLNGTLPKKRDMSIVRNLKLREFQEENFGDLILIRKSNLIKVHDKKPKLDLDFRIPPRVRPQHTARIQENPETINQKALQSNPVQLRL